MRIKKFKKITDHFLRNIFLYFILYVFLFLIYDFQTSLYYFFIAAFIFALSYLPIYLLNDYADRKDDKNIKDNLYNECRNKDIYWTVIFICLVTGLLFSFIYISYLAVAFILILYILNYLYSFKPFRLRNKIFLRELNIFVIYFVRWLAFSVFLGFSLNKHFPIYLFLMASAFAAINVSLYKRHIKVNKLVEYFFGGLFLIFWIATMFNYHQSIYLLAPLLPIGLYLALKYRNKQIPIGRYQIAYFTYALAIYLLAYVYR